MSAGSTMRANKSNKDKSAKTQQNATQNAKDGTQKIKATAEQMRIANLLVDKADADEEQMEQRINQICDLTHRSRDDVIVALHDCNDDPNKAIEMLLEGDSGQGEWQETGKKKKKTAPTNNNTQVNNTHQQITENSINSKPDHKGDRRDRDNNREQSNDRDFHDKRSESSSRGRRNDDIPRFRGKNKNKENSFQTFDNNDRNRADSASRGRGRGRGTRGVGRGRGRGGRTAFGGPPRKESFEKGPQIDTWTNDQATSEKRFPNAENWDNEDMNEDVWQGSLAETKVFTASNQNNDINSSMINDISDIGVTNKGFGIGQSNALPQSLDLSSLLQSKPSASMSEYTDNQSNQSMSQYTKQATENIKSIVGIGVSQASVSQSQQSDMLTQHNNTIGMIPDGMSSTSSIPGAVTSQSMPQRSAKPQRSKLPPPSKIPASAVEMPGHITTSLDVQFGFTDQSGGGSLSFGSNDNSGLSFNNSSLSSKAVEPPSESTTISQLISNITPPKPSLADQTSTSRAMYSSQSASTTPTKDYSQSPLSKTAMSPPDPYVGSQGDRKTSPLMSSTQRQGQTGSQNSYSSTYQSNRYQSHKANNLAPTTTSGYTHSTNSLSSSSRLPATTSYQTQSNQYQSGYQSSTFQNTSGGYSGQNQNSIYQGSSNQPSYASQSTYRDTVTTASYVPTQPSAYISTTQAGSGYQTGQTGASYTSGQSSYPSSQNSYQGSLTGQTGSSFQGSQNVTGSYQSTGYTGQSNTNYQTGQSATTYPSSVTPTNSSYTRESGQTNSSYSNYGSNSLQQNTKLTDGLSKMTVNDSSSLDSHKTAPSFEHTATSTSSASLASTTATTSTALASGSVIASGSVNVSNALGLSTAATVSSAVTSTSRTSTLLGTGTVSNTATSSSSTSTSKAPPNLPPGVPLLGPNFIMGQPGVPGMAPFYAPQQPVYSYEDLQLLQRLPLQQAYYDQSLSLQQPATSLATRDQNALANVPYTGNDGKMNRVDAQSPVQGPTSQPQSQSAQQQTFMNPQLPPGYGYFYHGGMLPGGFSYTPTMYPVTPVTNAAHGGSTVTTTQFQKPGQYVSHDYGTATYADLSQTQDYKAAYGTVTQNQSKAAAPGIKLSSSSTDMTAAGYGKTHAQPYDKQGYHAGTPPPFNLQMASQNVNVNQAGPMGTPQFTPVFPMMAHQQHSQMMHHQLQQDTATGSTRAQQGTQPKTGSTKTYGTTYWGNA